MEIKEIIELEKKIINNINSIIHQEAKNDYLIWNYLGKLYCYKYCKDKCTFYEYLENLKEDDFEKIVSSGIQEYIAPFYESHYNFDDLILGVL